ncbi:cupin domain-containing protein [Paraburkholderia oxyphila]|uniref:cupin domain-containing protein n=1 Tax=Paraburkholderia oxyphila TaxID=614212 RepID=UPI001C3F14DB|nr:cupin domain-containing protein [Paraburkholderia oxyphila]
MNIPLQPCALTNNGRPCDRFQLSRCVDFANIASSLDVTQSIIILIGKIFPVMYNLRANLRVRVFFAILLQHYRTPSNVDPMAQINPGQTVRALRNRLGLTLQEVSERTGLAISTISKLEMGKISLSYEKLLQLSVGLGIDISQLLGLLAKSQEIDSAPSAPGRRSVQRLGEGLSVETPCYLQNFLAVDVLNKQLVPIYVEVRARTIEEFKAEFGGLIRHAGEEFGYVLEGEIAFHTEFYAPVVLKAGESVYFDSGMGHAYLAASETPCRLLSICSGNEEHIVERFQKR